MKVNDIEDGDWIGEVKKELWGIYYRVERDEIMYVENEDKNVNFR